MSVCSGVRTVLFTPPSSLISLQSRTHSGLVRAGGGPGRNCEPLSRTHGVTLPHWVEPGSTVMTYTPGAVTGRYVFGASARSLVRMVTISVPTFSPTATPSVLALPSGMAPSDLANA